MQSLWKTEWRCLKKLKIELPYDPAISPLGIHPDKTISQKDTCTPIFIAALSILAKTWRQPKCPQADEQLRKMWKMWGVCVCVCTGILLGHKKRKNAICNNIDRPRDDHTK